MTTVCWKKVRVEQNAFSTECFFIEKLKPISDVNYWYPVVKGKKASDHSIEFGILNPSPPVI